MPTTKFTELYMLMLKSADGSAQPVGIIRDFKQLRMLAEKHAANCLPHFEVGNFRAADSINIIDEDCTFTGWFPAHPFGSDKNDTSTTLYEVYTMVVRDF